jgi:hypothetical protein
VSGIMGPGSGAVAQRTNEMIKIGGRRRRSYVPLLTILPSKLTFIDTPTKTQWGTQSMGGNRSYPDGSDARRIGDGVVE